MPLLANFGEALLASVAAALGTLLSFIPGLIGAVLLLVIGWIVSDVVARVVTTLLRRIGFETAAEKVGATHFIAMTGARSGSAAAVFGEIVKWFIRLLFVEMAAQALHITVVSGLINSILLFIPNLVVALIVLMVGMLIANFVSGVVRGSASEMGFANPNLLAGLARVAIVTLAILIALSQVGIAAILVDTLFMALVGAVALALGLAFGLGGREVAGQMWTHWYTTGRGAVQKMEQKVAASAEPTPSPAAQAAMPPPPAPGYQQMQSSQPPPPVPGHQQMQAPPAPPPAPTEDQGRVD